MKKIQWTSGLIVVTIALVFSSCTKEKQSTLDATSILDENIASFAEKSTSEMEDAATLKSGGGNPCSPQDQLPECAVYTEDSESYPKNITIDFGDGCADPMGRVRSGIIHINLTDDMLNEGAVRTVTFENYAVNDIEIEGIRTTTNTGLNEFSQPTFSRNIEMSIERPQGTFERTCNGNVAWVSGFDTPECGDNVFTETGSGTLTRPNGVVMTHTITEALLIDRNCGYVIDGIIEISGPNGEGNIDFGDGTCDDQAIVTRPNGDVETITLHH
ncbi:MAG: hypothetical protein ACKVOK_15685 [Flavobacteriales bacterium]